MKEKGHALFVQYVEIGSALKRFRLSLLYMTYGKSQVHKRRFSKIYDLPPGHLVHYAEIAPVSTQTNTLRIAILSYKVPLEIIESRKSLYFIAGLTPILPKEFAIIVAQILRFSLAGIKNGPPKSGGPKNHSSIFSLMCTSSSCFCSTVLGAPIIRSWAFLFMGKVMTSRMLSSPVSSMISRSTPGAAPAWGGAP